MSERDLSTQLLGQAYDLPVGIAPMGVSALTAFQGDLALARAARQANIPMIISGAALIPMEKIVAENPDVWFQAYLSKEKDDILALMARVRRAWIGTLVVTVDTAVVPSRENNLRTGYQTPIRPNLRLLYNGMTHPEWAVGTFMRSFMSGITHFDNMSDGRGSPLLSDKAVRDFSGREYLTWDMMKLIRSVWTGKLVIKGLVAPEDVRDATRLGADAIILSNHGGRQLDGTISPLRSLRAAVGEAGPMPVMIDSGFRRGTDVLKAIALGAAFVFIGRPFNYAATLGGERGVLHTTNILGAQLRAVLGMLGRTCLREVGVESLFLDNFRDVSARREQDLLEP